jgi:hypothetical protein
MEPRTSNIEGEEAFREAGREIGVNVEFYGHSASNVSTLEGVALMPRSGAELAVDFQPGIAGAMIAGGFLLCMVAVLTRRRH